MVLLCTMRIVLLLVITLWEYVYARNIYAKLLNGKSHFTELSLNRFISKMAKLNRLQSDIMKVPVEARDDHAFFDHIMNDNVTRPDLQPYLFEGDIILTDEQMDIILRNTEDQLWAKRENSYRPRSQRSLTSSLSLRWSSFPIPYFINTVTGVNQAAVLAGISLWQEETCITFQRQYSRPRRNGFEFILGDSCSSYIGKVGFTSQLISIGYGCNSLGTVTHEIGHALGFFHEQSRYDRDDYVTILTQNISPNYLSQFTKQSRSNMEDYGVGYDYGSVMHYGQSDFSANIRNTIQTIDSNYQTTIGQRVAPSFMDIKRINLAYCNSTCSTPLSCLHGGYTDPKNCSKCRCPDGFGGNLCEQAASNPPGCGDSNLNASINMDILSVTGEKTCSFIITAPEGRRVYFGLISFTFAHQIRCEYNYLEIKYRKDMQKVGARFCTSYPRNSLSESNILAIIYKGIPSSGFSLQFRYDPAIPLPTRSSTVSQTTFSTLSTLGTTRTDPIATTMMPTPFTLPSIPPWITTRLPCSKWSKCTAQCGGCGTRSRRCEDRVETVYCNKEPCRGGYCCRPFLYVNQGFCFRPFTDEQLVNKIKTHKEALGHTNLLDIEVGRSSNEGSGEM